MYRRFPRSPTAHSLNFFLNFPVIPHLPAADAGYGAHRRQRAGSVSFIAGPSLPRLSVQSMPRPRGCGPSTSSVWWTGLHGNLTGAALFAAPPITADSPTRQSLPLLTIRPSGPVGL